VGDDAVVTCEVMRHVRVKYWQQKLDANAGPVVLPNGVPKEVKR
jgi:hypothetical protein